MALQRSRNTESRQQLFRHPAVGHQRPSSFTSGRTPPSFRVSCSLPPVPLPLLDPFNHCLSLSLSFSSVSFLLSVSSLSSFLPFLPFRYWYLTQTSSYRLHPRFCLFTFYISKKKKKKIIFCSSTCLCNQIYSEA